MSDFEKVYSVKFKVDAALKQLEKLRKVVKDIEGNKLVKVFDGMEKSLKRVDDQAKKTTKTINRGLGKRAEKDLKNLGKAAKKSGKEIREVGRSADYTGDKMKTLGRNMRRYVLLPLVAIGVASVKATFEINKSMANVSTLLDAPIEKVRELKKGVQDLAKDTGKSTTDLADGLYQTVSALGESAENMDQLKIAAKAAVAGLAETKDAIGLLTAVGKGYNDTTKESLKRTSDLAFQTVKLGVTTFPELAASMGRVVPLAASLNTSQEELFGTMATLTGVTGNTSEVVTQLSSLYSDFLKPSEKMQDSLALINKENKEYNFQSVSMMVKTLGLQKSLALLGDTVDNDSDALAKMFKRKEGLLAAIPLLTTQSENYTNKLAAMEEAVGATDEAYRKQTEGINKQGHEWEKTKQRMVVFAQRIGDRLLPVLDKLFDHLEPILEVIEEMDDETMDTAIAFGKFALEMTLLVSAFGKLNPLLAGFGGLAGTASSGMAGMGANALTANGNILTMNASLGNVMRSLGPIALTLGAALITAQLINAELDRADRRKLKKGNKNTKDALKDSDAIRSGSLQEVSNAEQNILKRFGSDKHSGGAAIGALSNDRIQGLLDSMASDPRTSASTEVLQRQSDLEMLLRARKKKSSILSRDVETGVGTFGISSGETLDMTGPMHSAQQQGLSAGNFTGGNTTIHISGASSPEATAAATMKLIDKRMAKDLRQAESQAVSDEQ